MAESLSFYVEKLFWPANLMPIYLRSVVASLRAPLSWEVIALPCLVLVALVASIRRARLLAFAILFWLAGLLPTIGLTTYRHQNISIIADRYSYLSLAGAALVVAWALGAAGKREGLTAKATKAFTVACALTMACLGFMSASQARMWRDNVSLYQGMIDKAPNHYIAMASLGTHYFEEKDYKRAEELLVRSIKTYPEHYAAHHTLGALLLRQERHDDLIEHCREWFPVNQKKSAMFRENITHMHHYYGVALHAKGMNDAAIEHFEAALAMAPAGYQYADDAHFRLAALFLERSNFAKARDHFRSYLRMGTDPKKREAAKEQLEVLEKF